MAVFLAELAVREIMATLQRRLPDELSKIEVERADGVSLPAPERWRERPAELDAILGGVRCAVEVYEESLEASVPEASLCAGSGATVSSEASLVVRVSHAATGDETPSEMAARTRRYAAAVVRVLRSNPSLESAADGLSVRLSGSVGLAYADADVEGRVSADRAVVRLTATLNEGTANEGEAGGAALAAPPLPLD